MEGVVVVVEAVHRHDRRGVEVVEGEEHRHRPWEEEVVVVVAVGEPHLHGWWEVEVVVVVALLLDLGVGEVVRQVVQPVHVRAVLVVVEVVVGEMTMGTVDGQHCARLEVGVELYAWWSELPT